MTDFFIPLGTLGGLEEAPNDRPVMMLLRHSVRPPIPPGQTGDELRLTEEGVRLAEMLGTRLGRRLSSVRTSPIPRCVETGAALARGAGIKIEGRVDRLLGAPGIYVNEPRLAWEESWRRMPYEELLDAVVEGRPDLVGFALPARAAGRLLEHMVEHAAAPGIHVFVSHDSVVLPTAAHLLKARLRKPDWPWYLDALFVWRQGDSYQVRYRGLAGASEGPAVLFRDELTEEAVLDFGRRQLQRLLGDDFPGRVFLAGGAFKSLLTGKPPREVDIWAASEGDRRRLLEALVSRGARELPEARPFGDAFRIGELTIDIPKKTEPATLEDRLARFDLELSSIGVEFDGGRLRAVLHPSVQEAVRLRKVRFQKPLANWKYALYSLERARRYAVELGYVVEPDEEAEVWKVFEAQDDETRRGMLERYRRCTDGRFGVPEEIECRLR